MRHRRRRHRRRIVNGPRVPPAGAESSERRKKRGARYSYPGEIVTARRERRRQPRDRFRRRATRGRDREREREANAARGTEKCDAENRASRPRRGRLHRRDRGGERERCERARLVTRRNTIERAQLACRKVLASCDRRNATFVTFDRKVSGFSQTSLRLDKPRTNYPRERRPIISSERSFATLARPRKERINPCIRSDKNPYIFAGGKRN